MKKPPSNTLKTKSNLIKQIQSKKANFFEIQNTPNETKNVNKNISTNPKPPQKPKTFVPPIKKVVKEIKKEENEPKESNIFDKDNKEKNESEVGNIFDIDKKEKNEVKENIFDIPKKKMEHKTTIDRSKNKNIKTNSKIKTGKDLFNFEEDAEEDIFSKKDGVSSIFDTDDNDKDKKDNAVSSIFDQLICIIILII